MIFRISGTKPEACELMWIWNLKGQGWRMVTEGAAQLKIAGIVHNDLLGRERLRAWLRGIKASERTPPAFVAVEYDQNMFRQLAAQRPTLRALAREEWPDSSESILDTIENSLCYEGDVHEGVFPGVETVWLDKGRTVKDPTVVSAYAHDRLNLYKSFVARELRELSDANLLTMSRTAWARGDPPEIGGSVRDAKFARMILDRLRLANRGWAVAAIGSSHAGEVEGSTADRLRSEGIKCQVSFLSP